MDTKPRILALMQIPPPVHGAATVGKQILDSKKINNEFNIEPVRISTKPQRKSIFDIFLKPLRYLWLLLIIISRLIRRRYDLIYITPCASGLAFYKDFIICMIAKIFSRKIVYHFHNKGIASNRYVPGWIKRLYFKNIYVVLLTPRLKYDVEDYVEDEKISFCANGIDFNHEVSSEDFERRMLSDNPVQILFLSNMIRTKGVLVLLEACNILNNRNIPFNCNFVGPWYENLKDEFFLNVEKYNLSDQIEYHGPLYGQDKEKIYRKSDIFVFPTYYPDETFGLVNIEAMSMGIPVISTDEGGIADVIRDGIDGYIVEKKNPVYVADKLEFLINNKEERIKMGKNALDRYNTLFTEEHFIANFINVINEVVKN